MMLPSSKSIFAFTEGVPAAVFPLKKNQLLSSLRYILLPLQSENFSCAGIPILLSMKITHRWLLAISMPSNLGRRLWQNSHIQVRAAVIPAKILNS